MDLISVIKHRFEGKPHLCYGVYKRLNGGDLASTLVLQSKVHVEPATQARKSISCKMIVANDSNYLQEAYA